MRLVQEGSIYCRYIDILGYIIGLGWLLGKSAAYIRTGLMMFSIIQGVASETGGQKWIIHVFFKVTYSLQNLRQPIKMRT